VSAESLASTRRSGHYAPHVSYTASLSLSLLLVFGLGIAMYVTWRLLDLNRRGFPQQLLIASIVFVLLGGVLLDVILDRSSPGLRFVGNYIFRPLLIVGVVLLVVRQRLRR